METALTELLGRRLAAQRLTGPPATGVAEYVGRSLAVQAQDVLMTHVSLGLRTGMRSSEVATALQDRSVVRTHVLRPTWHYVHREDLGWLAALTGPKIISGMAARTAALGIDDKVREDSRQALRHTLASRQATRAELEEVLPLTSYPRRGEVVGHLLLLAEAESLICSGLPRVGTHTYDLWEPGRTSYAQRTSTELADELVRRFVVGHGPTSIRDLQRWCNLSLTQIRHGLAAADLRHGQVAGIDLWWADEATYGLGSWLLPTFDEAYLSHDAPRFPRPAGHPMQQRHINPAAAGGGVVIVDGLDVGTFKRTMTPRAVRVTLALAPSVTAHQRQQAHAAAEQLATSVDRPLDLRKA